MPQDRSVPLVGWHKASPFPFLTRALLLSVAFAFASGVLLVAGARWCLPPTLAGPVGEGGWTNRSPTWFTQTGFFPPEIDVATARPFAWMGSGVRVVVPHLDRSRPARLSFRMRSGRPPGAPAPTIQIALDGAPRLSAPIGSDWQRVNVDVPARKGTARTLVTIEVSSTFVAPPDARALGLVVDEIAIEPLSGHFGPSWDVLGDATAAVFLVVLGVLLTGIPGWLGHAVAAFVSIGFAALLVLKGTFMGPYVGHLLTLAVVIGVIGAVVGVLRAVWPAPLGLAEWGSACGVLLGITAVKLALFLHPLAIVGDAMFQVHRAQLVHNGTYFFTSITPRPFFEFPYAIALYVAALPFWDSFRQTEDLIHLLRGLAVIADAFVGLAFYAAFRRQWQDGRLAILAAGLWPFARAPFDAISNANLTNVFGQAFFGLGLAAIAWAAAGAAGGAWVVALALAGTLMTVGFLGHFSTLLTGVPLALAVAACLVIGGRDRVRRIGFWVAVVTLAAALASYGVYYGHFNAVYRTTIARVLSHEGEASTRSIVAPPTEKLVLLVKGQSNDYGLPGAATVVAACLGALLLVRTRLREGVTLVLLACALVWLGCEALGVLTAIEVRANLAAAPMFTGLAAYGIGVVGVRSTFGRAGAIVAVGLIVASGVGLWVMCLGL